MFVFFLKKNFADGWDNLFFLILMNVFSILVVALGFLSFKYLAAINLWAVQFGLIVFGGIFMTVNFAQGACAFRLANFDSPSFGTFFRAFTYVWKIGFAFGCALTFAIFAIRMGIIYYIGLGSVLGLILVAFIGWFALISVMALQWFIPLYFLQEQNGFVKCLKKSFIIFFDNPWFSVGCFLYNILLLALSCITFLLAPGFAGLVLSTTNALRLRLKKYDWLEEMDEKEPGFSSNRDKRYNVPWEDLIKEDKETLGPRKLSSFIFPWK
ncbi:MAG: hypothetical protein IKP49_01400 [Treponema sp.]|nr:hypothetical protein [Treponema sp.]